MISNYRERERVSEKEREKMFRCFTSISVSSIRALWEYTDTVVQGLSDPLTKLTRMLGRNFETVFQKGTGLHP